MSTPSTRTAWDRARWRKEGTFAGAEAFNDLPWDTTKVTNMEGNDVRRAAAGRLGHGPGTTHHVHINSLRHEPDMGATLRRRRFDQQLVWDTGKVMNDTRSRAPRPSTDAPGTRARWRTCTRSTAPRATRSHGHARRQRVQLALLWDTSSVTNMDHMFSSAAAFDQRTSSVTRSWRTFYNADAFNRRASGWWFDEMFALAQDADAASGSMTYDQGERTLRSRVRQLGSRAVDRAALNAAVVSPRGGRRRDLNVAHRRHERALVRSTRLAAGTRAR